MSQPLMPFTIKPDRWMFFGEFNHILTPDGRFSMVDIAANSNLADNLTHPMGPFLYTVSLMHCMPVGLVGGGTGLGMMWGREKAVEMLKDARFHFFCVVQVLEMTNPFNLHFFWIDPRIMNIECRSSRNSIDFVLNRKDRAKPPARRGFSA